MTHPGLPDFWGYIIWVFMIVLGLWALFKPAPEVISPKHINLAHIKLMQPLVKLLTTSRWPLLVIKAIVVCFFILVIIAGLSGTPIPERNIATVLTWNIWWAGLIIFHLLSWFRMVCRVPMGYISQLIC